MKTTLQSRLTDGDGRRSLTFTDFRGRLILTRSFLDTGATVSSVQSGQRTDTYNVYDDAGNLLCVITPVAAPQMAIKGSPGLTPPDHPSHSASATATTAPCGSAPERRRTPPR